MFNNKVRPQFLLKRLSALGNPFKAKTTFPIFTPQWLFNKNLKTFFSSYRIPTYQFSSFQQNLSQTDYKQDLTLLKDYSQEQLTSLSELMEKYSQCEDLSLLTPDEVQTISSTLFELAYAYYTQGDKNKTIKYAKEKQEFCQKAGINDTFNLAQTYFLHAGALVDQGNLGSRQTIEYCLNEADRICKLLGEDKEAKSLQLQAWSLLILVEIVKNNPDKGLEIANSILQRTGDITEGALPSVLICVYRGMGFIYKIRSDTEKMIEVRTKGLEIALKHFGEDSTLAFEFSSQITEYLYAYQPEKAFPYAKQYLQIALKVFPKDSEEVAKGYFMLGNLHLLHKNYAEALASYEEALKFYERSPQENLEALGIIYHQSVGIYGHLQDFKGAANLLPKAELYKSFEPRNHAKIFEIYHGLGHIAFNEKDLKKAYKLYKECEKICDEAGISIPKAHDLDADLSAICTALGKSEEAEKYFQKILQPASRTQMAGPVYQILADGFEKRGLLKEALGFYKKAIEEYANVGESMNDPAIVKLFGKISGIESKLKLATQ